MVIQPYNRRDELIPLADHVANISAKHEGGDPDVEMTRAHPSDILDYFREKEEVEASGDMPHLLRNYLDKHDVGEPHGTRADGAWVELCGGTRVASSEVMGRRGDTATRDLGTRRRGTR